MAWFMVSTVLKYCLLLQFRIMLEQGCPTCKSPRGHTSGGYMPHEPHQVWHGPLGCVDASLPQTSALHACMSTASPPLTPPPNCYIAPTSSHQSTTQVIYFFFPPHLPLQQALLWALPFPSHCLLPIGVIPLQS